MRDQEAQMGLEMTALEHEGLRSHLLSEEGGAEQVAFLLATGGAGAVLRVVESIYAQPNDWARQGVAHLQLRDGVLDALIQRAHAGGLTLVEAHSHPFDWSFEPRFSWVDRQGLAEVAPHVVWRLPMRPYIALVFGQQGFDSLFWEKSRRPSGVVKIVADGVAHEPSGRSIKDWESEYE